MAALLYSYSTEHKTVDLNSPLWKIRINRPLEWKAIVKTLEDSPKEVFQTLLSVPDVKCHLNYFLHQSGNEASSSLTPSMFLNELCEYRSQANTSSNKKPSALTFGWLFQICLLSDIPFSSRFVTFLRELQDTYKPLKFTNEMVKIGGIPVEESRAGCNLNIDLGSTLEIEMQAEGVPEVVYQWFRLPPVSDDDLDDIQDQDWTPIDVTTQKLRIENFRIADIGSYRCYATHRIPVSYPSIDNASKSSTHQHSNYAHGVFGQSFEVKACPGSILVTKSPNVSEDGIVGGNISLECAAEIAPRTTLNKVDDKLSSLEYQWFHDRIALIGQTQPALVLKQLWLESAGEYFCRVSSPYTSSTKMKNTNSCHEEFCDSGVCTLKVALPSKDQLTNGDVQFSNEDIRILEHPDLSTNSEDMSTSLASISLSQNAIRANRRAAIGDKVSLSCTAVCKYPLKYEWLKQGIRRDLVSEPKKPDVYLPITPVAFGSQLNDEVDENERVSAWTYRCVIACPTTGQRVQSRPVTIEVSTFARTPEKSLPTFKIALVVCQEIYASSKYFPPLMAPKLDGKALVSALRQLDFQVFAFCNLTMDELKSAVDMFCAFIDRNTYALFYYNGHAIGHGNDVYLVSKDTDFEDENTDEETHDSEVDERSLGDMKLLWHGEIEEKLDTANPLLCTMIYDSCRSAPPESVASIIQTASSKRRTLFTLSSNFFFAYGTRPSMKSFEKVIVDYPVPSVSGDLSLIGHRASSSLYEGLEKRVSHLSQGLYMKHLLKHLTTPNLTISEIFARLYSSFTQEEDLSVLDAQRPEVKQSTEPFRLDASLRRASCTRQHKLFFNMTRYEAATSLSMQPSTSESTSNNRNPSRSAFDSELKYDLGLKWITNESNISSDETLIWITGNVGNSQVASNSSKYNAGDNLLRVKVLQEPNGFNNEALLILSLIGPRSKFESLNGGASENSSIAIQLIPCNVDLFVNVQHDGQQFDVKFEPCLKKAICGADGFVPTDGPIFNISADVPTFDSSNDELILGRCRMPNLQSVVSDLKFRAILHFRDDKMMCPSSGGDGLGVKYGVMKFALPIIRNYPKLKMNNTVYQNI